MSQPIDLSQFPDLPLEVLNPFAAVQFELSVERAARQHEQSVVAEKDAFITELVVGKVELSELSGGLCVDKHLAPFGCDLILLEGDLSQRVHVGGLGQCNHTFIIKSTIP